MSNGITNREVIENLKHAIAEAGPISDENTVSNRELFFLLLRYRALALSEKLRTPNVEVSPNNYQTITCVALDEISPTECPCPPEGNFNYRRTVLPIPKALTKYKVYSVGNHELYDFIEWSDIQELSNSRFKGELKKAFYTLRTLKDGIHIYIYNDKHLDSITLSAIFENPLEVQAFPDCEGKTPECFSPLEQEFIIDPDLLAKVIEVIILNKFKFRQLINDRYNNDEDESQMIKPPVK